MNQKKFISHKSFILLQKLFAPYWQRAPRRISMRKTSKAKKKTSTLSLPEVTIEESQSRAARDVTLREVPSEQKKKKARKTLYLARYE